MTYPGIRRICRRTLLAVPLAAAPLAAVAHAAPPQAAVARAECKVHAVHALKDGTGTIPPELQFLADELGSDQFAAYRSFRLLEAKALRLQKAQVATATLKTGHKLGLTLLGGDERRLSLHADLSDRKGSKPLLALDYTIENGGVFMIAGPAHQGGMLFFAIQCLGRA